MIVPGSASPLLTTTDGGYTIAKSLRFRNSASAYLNRTPGSAGNRQKWTWSAWVKRGALGTDHQLFAATVASPTNDTDVTGIQFDTSDRLAFGGGATQFVVTTQVFRDPSAWYHIVVAFDSTQATTSNRIKVYVNGSQVTAFSTANYVTQNLSSAINNNIQHDIGSLLPLTTRYFDGYMADVNFINDQQLTASSFGETDATTGVWKPKAYSGTYGTNGFYLNFKDNSAATAAAIGKDSSGNGNNWTPNNISVTAGATYDSMTDVPTLTSADAANYCVLNPLDNAGGCTISNGNLSVVGPTAVASVRGTFGVSSGKWYWEGYPTSAGILFGIATSQAAMTNYIGQDAYSWAYGDDGNKYNNNTGTAYGATYTTSDVIGVAFDADTGSLYFYKNNTIQNSGTAAFTGLTSGPYFPAFGDGSSGNARSANLNFGQRPFTYTPPTGYKALNTYNLE